MILSSIFSFFLLSSADAGPRLPVLIRDEHWRPRIEERELEDVDDSGGFQGRRFKLVSGIEEIPIALDTSDPDLRLRAATVLYHLTEAYRYWQNEAGASSLLPVDRMTIRLGITRGFSDLAHFEHERVRAEYNNALSIPGGLPMEGLPLDPWGPEIWFRPLKIIDTRELPESGLSPGANPITTALEQLLNPVRNATLQRLIQAGLMRIFYPLSPGPDFRQTLVRQAGTLAVMSLLLELSRRSDPWFLEKTFYLDTAMIPEVIRHEFAHIMLSSRLQLSHSTPVIEGLADYFAADQGNHPNLADRIRQYSRSLPKNGKNRTSYSRALERSLFANSDFVLSLLWQIRDLFGSRIANRLFLEATRMLNTRESGIRDGLLRALLESCRTQCDQAKRDRMRLRNLFESRGF